MPIGNVNLNANLDTAIKTNLDEFQRTAQPAAQVAQDVPVGLQARVSVEGGLPPRQSLGAMLGGGPDGPGGPGRPGSTGDLSNLATRVGSEANQAAIHDGGDAMQNVIEANAMNMKFQATMGVIAMQKGMVEAVSKTIKDIGTKVAQLAG